MDSLIIFIDTLSVEGGEYLNRQGKYCSILPDEANIIIIVILHVIGSLQ
jgi:hypothetical protein